jgi:hypothetical protein
MQEKDFRGLFVLVLAMIAGCAMLWTVTLFIDYPGGLGLLFREVVCVGVTVGVLALVLVDLFGIWTGHLPTLRKH